VDRLTHEEKERFVEAAFRRAGKEGLMVQFLLETGLRVSEFVALCVADVGPHRAPPGNSIRARERVWGKEAARPPRKRGN
jgi:integrase